MIRRVVLYQVTSSSIEEARARWSTFPETGVAVLRGGRWIADGRLSGIVDNQRQSVELRKFIGMLYDRLPAEPLEILVLREQDSIPDGLVEQFLEFCKRREYAFVSGKEVMRTFSIEKVSRSFHQEWLEQAVAFLPDGLLNGGARFVGNKWRLWLDNRFRKQILTDTDFAVAPMAYSLDLTRRCNLRCTKCPYHRDGATGRAGWRKKKWDMDLELVEKVARFCESGKTTIYLCISGESLLHPQFGRVLELMKRHECRFSYTSNGTLLTDEILKRMLDHGLTALSISLDAATDQTYQKIVPGGEFRKTQSNVENAVRLMRQYARNVSLSYLMIPQTNEDEFDVYLDRWLGLVDSVSRLIWADPETEKPYTSFDLHLPKERFTCIQPYQMQTVSPEGLVSPCCRDYESEMIVGNLQNETLPEAWTGQSLDAFRASMLPPTPGKPAPLMHPTCAACQMWSTGGGYYSIEEDRAVYTEQSHKVYASLPEKTFQTQLRPTRPDGIIKRLLWKARLAAAAVRKVT